MNIIRQKMKDLRGRFVSVVAELQKVRNIRERAYANDKISVVFICQYIPAWSKFQSIYNILNSNSGVSIANDTYEYFENRGYQCINAQLNRDKWFDLKNLNPNYIFYTRPYNEYLPRCYRSDRVQKYAKICSIIYGMMITTNNMNVVINYNFFKDVYFYFADSEYACKYVANKFKFGHRLKVRKSIFLGYPGLTEVIREKDKLSRSWQFSKESNNYKVIWTPRWTTDERLGTSNFFRYKKALIDYTISHKNISFLFRPHPMALENFVKTHQMTEEEVCDFKEICNKYSNLRLDNEKEYIGTMWGSDLLVTDLSSILVEYFVTGKPIIYCKTNSSISLTEDAKKIINLCYCVSNEYELLSAIEELSSGKDFLKEDRLKLIDRMFGEKLSNCPELIVDELLRDYNESK